MTAFRVIGQTDKAHGIATISWSSEAGLHDPTGLVQAFLETSRYDDSHKPPPQVCATATGPCYDATVDKRAEPHIVLLTVCSVFADGYDVVRDFDLPEFPDELS